MMMRRISVSAFAVCLSVTLLARVSVPLAAFCRLRIARPLSRLLASLSARVAFPIAGFLVLAALLTVAVLSLLSISVRRAAQWLSAFLCAILSAYCLLWGVLYACPGVEAEELTPQALTALCEQLIEATDRALSCASPEKELPALLETGCALMSAQTGSVLYPAKATRFAGFFSALGLAGLYFPLTGEAIVNPDDCPDTLPFTICHELAHQAGCACEAEASYCAFLACEAGNDPLFFYSAHFSMLLCAMKALRGVDQAQWRRCVDSMSAAVRDRFVRAGGLTARKLSMLCVAQQAVTHVFLRLNGDPYGLSSYERAVNLLAAHWQQIKFQGRLDQTA